MRNLLMAVLAALLVLACESGGFGTKGGEVLPGERVASSSQAWTAVTTNLCSDLSDYSSASMGTTTSGHLAQHSLTGSPAGTDRFLMLTYRNDAKSDIISRLGLQTEPTTIDIYPMPNRIAANYWGYDYGSSYYSLTSNGVEVIYNGISGSYEKNHYGHELAHVLIGYEMLSRWSKYPLPFVTQGLAELLDHAPSPLDDYHMRFVNKLRSRYENRLTMFEMDTVDFNSTNYGKAGSFMQALDDYGFDSPSEWNDFLQYSACTYSSGHYQHSVCGTLEHPSDIECVLEYAVETANGGTPSYADIFGPGGYWRTDVETALSNATELPTADKDAIQNLLDIQSDLGCSGEENWEGIRSTLDGFYCDSAAWDDSEREGIARRLARCDAYPVTLTIDHAYSIGTINFPAAGVFVTQTDAYGNHSQWWYRAERFTSSTSGWRITSMPEATGLDFD